MRRIVSLWCPHWAIELLGRNRSAAPGEPLAIVAAVGQPRLLAVGDAAAAAGIQPGMALADARALAPGLKAVVDAPRRRARALAGLADWAMRFTPWVATDGEDGLMLDVSGCAHLFGGEAALVERIVAAVARLGFTARAALADTPGAAWAVARFGGRPAAVVPPGGAGAALAPLPVAALRLPAATVAGLERLGLRTVADLLALPRAPLAARFGTVLGENIDRALGAAGEPVSPRRPVAPFVRMRAFAEPIATAPAIAEGLDALLDGLCEDLAARGRGARRLELTLFRVDRGRRIAAIGTSRPVRRPRHLARLFAEPLAGLDVGFGIESMRLAAIATDALPAAQIDLEGEAGAGEDLAAFVDRLVGRLGADNLCRHAPVASYLPERAAKAVAALAPRPAGDWLPDRRPLRLLAHPAPIEAVAMLPDAPPVLFRWRGRRHRVRRAEGPERIASEWWRPEASHGYPRDYYRVEDEAGGRFWLYREDAAAPGAAPRWFLHGLFA